VLRLARGGCGFVLAASFRALPAVNLTVLAAAIWMVSPVAGLRPSRASRLPTERAKKPGTLTLSPLATALSRVLCRLRSTASTVFCSRSACSATAVTSSLRFTNVSFMSVLAAQDDALCGARPVRLVPSMAERAVSQEIRDLSAWRMGLVRRLGAASWLSAGCRFVVGLLS